MDGLQSHDPLRALDMKMTAWMLHCCFDSCFTLTVMGEALRIPLNDVIGIHPHSFSPIFTVPVEMPDHWVAYNRISLWIEQGRPQCIRYLRISVGSVCPDCKIELFLSFQGVFEFWKSDHYWGRYGQKCLRRHDLESNFLKFSGGGPPNRPSRTRPPAVSISLVIYWQV